MPIGKDSCPRCGQPPGAEAAAAGATNVVGDGWFYILVGVPVLISGLLLRSSTEAPETVVGAILALFGAVITLIGVIAEGVRLGLRGR